MLTKKIALTLGLSVAAAGLAPLPSAQADIPRRSFRKRRQPVRFATFNVSLNRRNAGELAQELVAAEPGEDGQRPQAAVIAETIQRVNADVILLNEFDYDEQREAINAFRSNYLEVSQNGQTPVRYPYVFVAPVNTGLPSGFDLDNDGETDGPGDALGFGFFPGQYGMVLLSKYPILTPWARTFQTFKWKDMPGALLPDNEATPEPADWYSPEELDSFRLSSKSHWDLPIWTGRRVIHVLASHPTPPVFDGSEDRNGRRNHDEIRFWADYISGGSTASYIYDDRGWRGGLPRFSRFVVMGDLNADPNDGDSTNNPMSLLLDHPRINATQTPASLGAIEAAQRTGGANDDHQGAPRFDTGDFRDEGGPGNLRVDYALPSSDLQIRKSGVFWPRSDEEGFDLVGDFPYPGSDHRAVFVDLWSRGGL